MKVAEHVCTLRKPDIRFSDSYKHPNSRIGCDFGLLTSKNVFVMKFYIGIVLRGFIRGYLMQKLGPFVCMHFTPFIGYVFTSFFASENQFDKFRGT